ncbi:L-arabinose transport system substrate-binding protein [Kitasatospora sp. MAA19]|uniref:substrate-binding domain-containing protein n=1 Tax=Kitasatospora sp. MAA19 TaxID=3035090 RepID=UPI002475F631|nr:substrate-binding domain-containing protein [Kitasatospora sp. MAA19]MDH6707237.1 L-arabinose transport system substrate-binding protein [Kitasatospora sp. MAA19]
MFFRRRSRVAPLTTAGATALALALAGCSAEGPGTTSQGPLAITFLQKQGDQGYFIDEAAGAKAKAAELGVDLTVVDLGNDRDRALKEARTAVAKKARGLIAVVPDPSVGPELVALTRQAGIPLLSTDDQICADYPDPSACFPNGLVPRVGFNGATMGASVGERAATEYARAGWKTADTSMLSIWNNDIPVCRDRVNAAADAFSVHAGAVLKNTKVGTANTVEDARRRTAYALASSPGVKHWVVWGCNDENVEGGIKALSDAGFGPDNVIGIGIGAYLACKDWLPGKPSAMRAALLIKGTDVGALAVQQMVDRLKGHKDLPRETIVPAIMVDPSNWQASGALCT